MNKEAKGKVSLIETRRNLFRKIKQSVVAIVEPHHFPLPQKLEVADPDDYYPFSIVGSGFIINSDGIVLTAHHAVEKQLLARRTPTALGEPEPPPPIIAIHEGFTEIHGQLVNDFFVAPGKIVESNNMLDLAAIAISQPRDRNPIELPSDHPKDPGRIAVIITK